MTDDTKTDTQIGEVRPTDEALDAAEAAELKQDPTEESFDRLKPIARQIIEHVASMEPAIGNNTEAEDTQYFKLAEDVLGFMRDGSMRYMEKENLFALILQPFDKIRTIVLSSLNKSANHAVDLRMGKQFGEITLSDLDEILKSESVD